METQTKSSSATLSRDFAASQAFGSSILSVDDCAESEKNLVEWSSKKCNNFNDVKSCRSFGNFFSRRRYVT
jgi:hypothetical protein